MKSILFLLILNLVLISSYGQKKDVTPPKKKNVAASTSKDTSGKANNVKKDSTKPATTTSAKAPAAKSPATVTVLVNISEKTAYKQIPVSKDGEILLDAIPDTLKITLVPPFDSYNIQFNRSPKSFVTDFTKERDDDKTVYVSENWINSGVLTLIFNKGSLIGILGRPSPISNHTLEADSSKKYYIKILYPTKKADSKKDDCGYSMLTDSLPNQVAIEGIFTREESLLCEKTPCTLCAPQTGDKIQQRPILLPFPICPDGTPNTTGPTKYKVVYDRRRGHSQFQYYELDKHSKCYSPVNKIYPKADEKITYYLLVPSGTTYTLNSTSLNQFVDTAFISAVNTVLSGASAAAKGTPPTVADTNQPIGKIEALNNKELVEKLKDTALDNILAAANSKSLDTLIHLHNKAVDILKYPKMLKINFFDSTNIAKTKSPSDATLFNSFFSALKLLKENIPQAASDITANSLLNANAALAGGKGEMAAALNIKNILLSLKLTLEEFNSQNQNIDFRESGYRKSLLCLLEKIETTFGISTPRDSCDFTRVLINWTKENVSSDYYSSFPNLLKQIVQEYMIAVTKQATNVVLIQDDHIPNMDQYFLHLQSSDTAHKSLVLDSFSIKQGLKIDLSAGAFITGINTTSYILSSHTFRYKVTKDTILPNGNDSVMYTGSVKDTTGNLIQRNRHKFNFNTGILFHIYPRTGHYVDYGGVAGFILNSSDFTWLLGGSAMFHMGSIRISLSAGAAIGKQDKITADAKPYMWNGKADPNNGLYNSVYQTPSFYKSLTVTTYSAMQVSYFAGLTFNFSSLKLNK